MKALINVLMINGTAGTAYGLGDQPFLFTVTFCKCSSMGMESIPTEERN
jgi:hypothetical protein